jgi:hypothetical protein
MNDEGARNRRIFEGIKRRFREYDQRKQEADRRADAAAQCATAMLDRIVTDHGRRMMSDEPPRATQNHDAVYAELAAFLQALLDAERCRRAKEWTSAELARIRAEHRKGASC